MSWNGLTLHPKSRRIGPAIGLSMRDIFKIALFFLAVAAGMTLVVVAAQCHGGVP